VRRGFITRAAAGLLSAVTVFSLAACSKGETEAVVSEAAAIKVTVAKPTVGYIDQTTAFTGKVMPDDSVSVYGKSSGTVLKTYFEIGDTVEEGQLLFELDPKDYQIALEQSKLAYDMALQNVDIAENGSGDALTELQYKSAITTAQNAYENARATLMLQVDDSWDFSMSDFKRARNKWRDASNAYDDDPNDETYKAYVKAEQDYEIALDDFGITSRNRMYLSQFETAYDAYLTAVENYEIYKSTQKGENAEKFDMTRQQAKLQYESMLQTMDNLKVYAPISGVIEGKNVTVNGTYAPSLAGYVVSNKDIMVVTFAVSGDVANEMELGDKVVVENGKQQFEAEITEIGSMVNERNGLFTVKAKLPEQAKMLSGVSVKLTAITAKSDDAVLIPVSSVYYDNGDAFVYVEKDGVVVTTPVTVGIISGDIAEILDGVDTSSKIITSWNPNLTNGIAVEVSEEV